MTKIAILGGSGYTALELIKNGEMAATIRQDPYGQGQRCVEIVTKFTVPASAHPGPAVLTGKLRYQACTDRLCLPPKTVDVSLPVTVVK